MKRQTFVVAASATGAFVIAGGVGAVLVLQSGSGSAGSHGTTVAAAAAAAASFTPQPSAPVSPSTASLPDDQASAVPAPRTQSSCTIGQAGNAVQVTLTAPDAPSACASLGQTLAKSSGGFWQAETIDGSLTLVCVMTDDGTSATVLDSGSEILGHALCANFEANGWTEDTAAEQQILQAAASAQAEAEQAAKDASDQKAAQNALATLEADTDLSGVLGAVQKDVSQAAKDLAQTKQDAAKGQGDYCYGVTTVNYDAQSAVGYDENASLSYDVNGVASAIKTLRSDETTLDDDIAALSADGLQTPDTNDAVSAAHQSISNAISATNNAIDTVDGYVQSAYQVADGMLTGDCATSAGVGDPPTPPTHLS